MCAGDPVTPFSLEAVLSGGDSLIPAPCVQYLAGARHLAGFDRRKAFISASLDSCVAFALASRAWMVLLLLNSTKFSRAKQ